MQKAFSSVLLFIWILVSDSGHASQTHRSIQGKHGRILETETSDKDKQNVTLVRQEFGRNSKPVYKTIQKLKDGRLDSVEKHIYLVLPQDVPATYKTIYRYRSYDPSSLLSVEENIGDQKTFYEYGEDGHIIKINGEPPKESYDFILEIEKEQKLAGDRAVIDRFYKKLEEADRANLKKAKKEREQKNCN